MDPRGQDRTEEPVYGEARRVERPAGSAGMSGGWSGRWDWGGGPDDRRVRLPWIGIFLVVLGALLLIDRALPAYRDLGNVLVLAAGLAALVAWAINRSTFALYAGAFLTAAAIPSVVQGLGYAAGPGFGTLCYGIAFLFVAVVGAARGAGWGWQVIVGAVLVALGASQLALPDLAGLILPTLLVILGILMLARGRR